MRRSVCLTDGKEKWHIAGRWTPIFSSFSHWLVGQGRALTSPKHNITMNLPRSLQRVCVARNFCRKRLLNKWERGMSTVKCAFVVCSVRVEGRKCWGWTPMPKRHANCQLTRRRSAPSSFIGGHRRVFFNVELREKHFSRRVILVRLRLISSVCL